MTADAWNPTQYERFAAERSQPFYDLAGLVRPLHGGRLVDLGCGPGSLTVELPALVDAGEVLGIDNSEAMLAAAAPLTTDRTHFGAGDLGTWCEPGAWDAVLANASLQWVPDHAGVLARWQASLRPGGQLGVQMPTNADHPSHVVAAEVASEEPFASAFPDGPPPDVVAANVLRPEQYAQLLDDLGFAEQHVRLQVYPHHLASTGEVVEWVKGTALTRFQRQLPPELFDEYVARYRTRLLEVLGEHEPYFYAFKRILLWAR